MPENKLQSSETSVLRERSLLSAQGLLSQGLDPRWECLAAGALNFLENSPTRPCRHSGRCWVLCGALAESYPVLHVLGCWGEASPWQEGLRAAAGRQSCPFCLGGRAPSACWSAFALLPPDVLDLKVAFVRTLLGSDLCTRPAEILLGTRCVQSPGRSLGLVSPGAKRAAFPGSPSFPALGQGSPQPQGCGFLF